MLAERTVEGHTEEPADAVAAAAYVEPEDVAAQDFVEEKVIKQQRMVLLVVVPISTGNF